MRSRTTLSQPYKSVDETLASARSNPYATRSWRQTKSLSGFKAELLANLAGTGWSALMQLACIPLYLKFLGVEAYGLIGFYLMFQAMVQVLDLGLSPTINREMARYSVLVGHAGEARDLVRTLEVGYWLIGLGIAAALLGASTWIATHWLRAGSLPIHTVNRAVVLMGFLAFFQWPVSFYQGGLMGLRRQVLFNALRISVVTLNSAGAVLILWLVSPTIQAFLGWQVLVGAAQAVALAILLWKCMPSAFRAPRINLSLVRKIGPFAAGMSGIVLIGLMLTQIDKVIVSKLLDLKTFGYYTLAWTVANGLSLLSAVIFNVVFPRMSAQVAADDQSSVKRSYHAGSQLMAVVILPLAAVLAFFPSDVMLLWTRNAKAALFAAPILPLLVIGCAANALLFLPYSLQLASGWTKLNLIAGMISILVVIPVSILSTEYFGAIGAAAIWAVVNIINLVTVVPIMHRRLFPREAVGYFSDIGFPLIATMGVGALGRLLFTNLTAPAPTVETLATVWMGSLVVAVLSAPRIRERVVSLLKKEGPSYA